MALKYGTICGKHQSIYDNAQSIDVNIDECRRIVEELIDCPKDLLELLMYISSKCCDIQEDVERCLDDGQRMENSLNRKRDRIKELEQQLEHAENERESFRNDAEYYEDLYDRVDAEYTEQIESLEAVISNQVTVIAQLQSEGL